MQQGIYAVPGGRLGHASASPSADAERYRWPRIVVVVFAAYYLGARVGLALTFQPLPISVFWPCNAMLFAAMLLLPTNLWWLVAAAALPAHLLSELMGGIPLSMVLCWYLSNVTEALIGAACVRVLCAASDPFHSARGVSAFLAAVVASTALSSFLDSAFVQLNGWGHEGFWEVWRSRLLSNATADLIVVPVVVTWGAMRWSRAARGGRMDEAAILYSGLAALAVLLFNTDIARGAPAAQVCLPVPFLLWAALRFGPAGTTSAIAVMVVATIFGTVNGLGPFASSTPQETAREMQLFLSAVAVPMLLLAAVLDERARVELDAREQRLQLTHLSRVAMLGELSGGIAHELNQPLTAILSNAQAAQHLVGNKSADPEILLEILRDIIAADQRAGEVIRRLRTLFKRGEPQFQPLDPNELVHEVLGIVHGDLVTRSVEVVPELAAALPRVQGDRVELEQVMLNLVMNACDAMAGLPPEQRRLTVRTRAVDAEDGAVQVSFSDRGPGFTPEQYARLFEPFYTTKPRGLGLGLSISRAIIRAHHGRLWGSSTPGKGASFHMVLPALSTKGR